MSVPAVMTNIFKRWFAKKPDDKPLRDVAALTASLVAPAVHVLKTDSPASSHFGGLPNLPDGVPWPEHKGRKLGFLARLSLAEIHRTLPIEWLPGGGALLFFYDMEEQPWGFDPKDRGCAVVLHAADLPAPVPQPATKSKGKGAALPHRNIAFRRIDVLPSWERDAVGALDLSDEEADLLGDLTEAVFQGEPRHQIAGFPAPVQGDGMELECQLVTNGLYCGDARGYQDERAGALKPGAENWRLLLQMDSDDGLDLMWGDLGVIYYWIEAHAARSGKFENVWLVLQCH